MSNFDHFVGTRPVSDQHAFDTEALTAWLARNMEGFVGPLTVEMFKGGQSNPTYKLITPGASYVMRAKPGPVAKLLPSAHAIEREFAVMSGLYGTDVPVPRMFVLCEDESVIGRAFYVMECMQGRVLWDQSLPGMTPAERGDIYNEMNRVIAALHTVKFADRGLASYGKPGNYFDRQIGRWSKQYVASITQPIEEMDRLMEWLPANMPASARDEGHVSIVHGDYRLDNLMFHPTEPLVIAVLDWELSTLGHPLADVAYSSMPWLVEPDAFEGLRGLDLAAQNLPTQAVYLAAYAEASGRRDPVLPFHHAFSLFRFAVILEGIAARAKAGNAAGEDAVAIGRLSGRFARYAAEIVA